MKKINLPPLKQNTNPRGLIKKKDYTNNNRLPLKHPNLSLLNHYQKNIKKMPSKSGTPDILPHPSPNNWERGTTTTEEAELEECTYEVR